MGAAEAKARFKSKKTKKIEQTDSGILKAILIVVSVAMTAMLVTTGAYKMKKQVCPDDSLSEGCVCKSWLLAQGMGLGFRV